MKNSLGDRLIEIGYRGLFMHGDHSLANSIWDDGKSAEQLKGIVLSVSSSLHERFLAAEVLRFFNVELDSQSNGVLAEAYAYALQNTSADRGNIVQLNGNLWGLLYEEADVGYLGKHLISFGNAAVPHLVTLLDDDAGRILYEGSEEATIGSAYQYRVKDIAAFYLAKIENIPVKLYESTDDRDAEIERLKEVLKSHKQYE